MRNRLSSSILIAAMAGVLASEDGLPIEAPREPRRPDEDLETQLIRAERHLREATGKTARTKAKRRVKAIRSRMGLTEQEG